MRVESRGAPLALDLRLTHVGKQARSVRHGCARSSQVRVILLSRDAPRLQFSVHSSVNLQLSSIVNRFSSHARHPTLSPVHDSGQVCMFQGKTCSHFRAFTTYHQHLALIICQKNVCHLWIAVEPH
jgi:hypothetical protein